MKNIILCLSHSSDFYNIDLVQQELMHLGYQTIRINCDEYPMQWQMSHRINKGAEVVTFNVNAHCFDSGQIAGVWLRKNALPKIEFDQGVFADRQTENAQLSQCTKESNIAKNLCLTRLDNIPWIDAIDNIAQAEDKGLQLAKAREAGLVIPDTLLTNCPKELTAFYHEHNGEIVAKMLTPLTTSMNRPKEFVYTSRINQQHLDNMDGLKYSPMVFQKEITKAFELRVAYVNGQCFAGKIDTSQATNKTQVDWRQAQVKEFSWQHHDLDNGICQKIEQMMRSLNLNFGAIDIIVTPEKQHVFLEVNPIGEWGMLEKELNLPISAAIAKALDKKIKAAQNI